MIEVKDLRVRFGKTNAVDALSFTLGAGESLALWGENGAGKTTAIRALLGLLPFEGHATIGGHELPKAGRAARAMIGHVPQRIAFHEEMRTMELLRFFSRLRGASDAEALPLLERVGLAEHGSKAVAALSGGMKQRLALAVALLGDPPILILDEPTANLDRAARTDFVEMLVELRKAGKTLLVTSHRIEEVRALADRALVLEHGTTRFECAAEELEGRLFPESVLRIGLESEEIDPAVDLLRGSGFDAKRNGHGLLVRVSAGHRAAPLETLIGASISVDDLSLEPLSTADAKRLTEVASAEGLTGDSDKKRQTEAPDVVATAATAEKAVTFASVAAKPSTPPTADEAENLTEGCSGTGCSGDCKTRGSQG